MGGTYQARSPYVGADQAINIYRETREIDGEKRSTFYGTPGLLPYLTVSGANGGCRGLFSQDGRTWGVWGTGWYELDLTALTATLLATVENDGGPVSWASNGQGGNQVGLVSGGSAGALYVLDLSAVPGPAAVTTPTLPFTGPVMIAFLDGYALINQHESPIVWYSDLEDMTMWDALNFFARSGTSDNIKAIAVTRDRVWTLGSRTTTLFYDSGDVDTPFLPYPGTTIQTGIVTHWSLEVFDDILYWIAQSETGVARVVRAKDPAPTTMSTPPIAEFLDACTTLENAEILAYGQQEHVFIALTCPGSPEDVQTYCYDELEQLWHARAGWIEQDGTYTRWRARGCAEAEGNVFVGDYATGVLYTLDLDTYTDNGEILMRERVAPYLGTAPQWRFLDSVQLLTQAGAGITSGQGSDPTAELMVSRDGANTWISAGVAALGAMGQYLTRAIWRRLGRVREDLLVLRVRQSDPVPCVWAGLNLNFQKGSGQL